MNTYKYPTREEWQQLLKRPAKEASQLNAIVGDVLAEVRRNGDAALRGEV